MSAITLRAPLTRPAPRPSLLPCPFCAAAARLVGTTEVRVECTACNARGPRFNVWPHGTVDESYPWDRETREKAQAAASDYWNRAGAPR